MKRESSEPSNEPALVDKRPRVDATEMQHSSPAPATAGSSKDKISDIIAENPSSGNPSVEETTAKIHETALENETKGKSKSRGRGRGRGRGRDQKGRADWNTEKSGGDQTWKGRPRRGTRDDDAQEEGTAAERGPRLPKRKVAMQIGFCGTGYNGMQIQKDAHTIENTLFEAMVKAGAVSKDNSDDPVKVNLQRAARTDAGVHAAGNVVSLKMITEPPDTPDLVARLNELLPPEIRVWKFARALNAFNSRACDSRVYEYLLPSYALLPPKPGTPMARHTQPASLQAANSGPDWHYWDQPEAGNLDAMRGWRISEVQLASLKASAKIYEGTHNFHNFTVGLDHSDPSGLRYMLGIDVKNPQIIDGVEWISIMFHGQSFMLHQIRKMTTLLIFTFRTGTPASTLIPKAFDPPKLTIPRAPSLGLLLQEPRFGTYNKHVADENELATQRGQPDRIRELIEWETLRDPINQFKNDYIYTRLRAEETKHGVFATWLQFIDEYDGPEFKYLNSQGEVPSEAVVNPGQRKRGATDKFREYLWKNPAGKETIGAESSDEEEKKAGAETEG